MKKKAQYLKSRSSFEPENTGNPTSLLDFVWWATGGNQFHTVKKADLKKSQMLIISGHGSGVDADFLAMDNSSRDSLTIRELSKALADIKFRLGSKIDILGLDSCLMSTAEVYYQVRDYVGCLVASEGFEPNSGWPYSTILAGLSGGASSVASKIVRDYIEFYFEYALCGQSVDLSACNVGLADKLKEAVNCLGKALIPALDDPAFSNALILAHWRAQSYKSDQYVDLADFAKVLQDEVSKIDGDTNNLKSGIDDACTKVINTVLGVGNSGNKLGTGGIVLESGYVGPAFQYSTGLSIYFPWSKISFRYGQLDLAKDNAWNDFIHLNITKTRRLRREGYPPQDKCGFLARIMDPYKLDAAQAGRAKADDPNNRADDPNNRADDPNNRGIDPYNRGKIIYRSMNNPPVGWRGCELLTRSSPRIANLLSKKPMKGE
jgi:hypothetical protein